MLLATWHGACAGGIEVGKYLCVVSHLVGIQQGANGQEVSGNFVPTTKEFFLTIAPVPPRKDCATTKPDGLAYWYFCLAKFAAQVSDHLVLRGDGLSEFWGFAGGDYLMLVPDSVGSDIKFSTVTGFLYGGLWASDGKCTRVR